jgi:hypothetical protein
MTAMAARAARAGAPAARRYRGAQAAFASAWRR